MTYDFSLDRKSTMVLSAGSVFLVLLVFFAGFLAGMSWRRESSLAVNLRTPATVAAAPPPKPASPKASTGEPAAAVPANPAPVAPAVPTGATPAAEAPPAASAATQAVAAQAASPAATSSVPAPEQNGVRLSVQVGSFLQKSNAEKLADQLKQSGYNPQIVLAGIGSKQWNVVRVGPYQDWDEAASIAAQLSRDQAAPAVIHPIR
jgi:cell division protein FtsN